jgi:hypothetical protein
VVFTDWLSITPAVGLDCFPVSSRTAITSGLLRARNAPSFLHRESISAPWKTVESPSAKAATHHPKKQYKEAC